MNKNDYSILVRATLSLILVVSLTGCGGTKKTVSNKPVTTHTPSKPKDVSKQVKPPSTNPVSSPQKPQAINRNLRPETVSYIDNYADIAKKKMREFHIPASITMAQGILESRSGNSTLTQKSNNHFGIKCHKGWTGRRTYHDDDKKGECFRVYDKAEESFNDHSKFLTTRKRYAFLFDLPKGDYIGWAFGLRQAGYATDNRYPQKLINIIEKYNLYKYDKEVLGKDYEKESQNTLYYKVKPGDNLQRIAKIKGIPIEQILTYNHMNTGDTIQPGEIIFLKDPTYLKQSITDQNLLKKLEAAPAIATNQPSQQKQDSPVSNPDYHIVKKGETLFAISRVYRMPIRKIKTFNHLKSNDIKVGQKLYLKPGLYKASDEKIAVAEVNSSKTPQKEEKDDNKTVKTQAGEKTSSLPDFHIVKEKETLFGISRTYGISLAKLKTFNHLSGNDIKMGQKIYLKPGLYVDTTKENEELSLKKEENTVKPVAINEEKPVTPTKVETPEEPAINASETVQIKPEKTEEPERETTTPAISKPVQPAVNEAISSITKQETAKPVSTQTTTPDVSPDTTTIQTPEPVQASQPEVMETHVTPKPNPVRTNRVDPNNIPDFHIVKEGETLYSIAYKYDLDIPLLRRLNHVKKNEVYIGQRIRLKETSPIIIDDVKQSRKKPSIPETYTVKPGETLYRIAKKFNMSVARLKSLNHLKDNSIFVGQVLYIK